MDFATHQHLLATDDDYRRRKGLAPLVDEIGTPRPHDPTVAIGVDPQLFAQVDAWDQERKAAQRRVDELRALIEAAQEQLVGQYAQAGMDEIRLNGRKGTLRSTLWARRIDESVATADVAKALRADGLDHLVTPESYNAQTISAWLRDLEREGKPIPPNVATVLEGHVVWRVGFTAGRRTETQARMVGAPSSVLGGASRD